MADKQNKGQEKGGSTYIEILITEWAHLPPESSHFKLCLVVHIPYELLPESQLPLELGLLLAVEIWSLRLEMVVLVLSLKRTWQVMSLHESLLPLIVDQLVVRDAEEVYSIVD